MKRRPKEPKTWRMVASVLCLNVAAIAGAMIAVNMYRHNHDENGLWEIVASVSVFAGIGFSLRKSGD